MKLLATFYGENFREVEVLSVREKLRYADGRTLSGPFFSFEVIDSEGVSITDAVSGMRIGFGETEFLAWKSARKALTDRALNPESTLTVRELVDKAREDVFKYSPNLLKVKTFNLEEVKKWKKEK